MRDVVEIGLGKTAQRGYHLDDIAIVPSRRTRDVDDVSTEWKVDAYPFKIPCVAHPSDATMSPQSAIALGRLGGLGVLNAEGLWTRYEDPTKILEELAGLDEEADATKRLQEVYSEPIRPELIAERVRAMREGGVTVAVRVSPQHTLALAPVVLDAGVDLLVIQGTLVSAEHVSTTDEPLNLKEFIADLDLPVIVGGCTDYKTALHLMRTGAAGVIVGVGADEWSTTDTVLGIRKAGPTPFLSPSEFNSSVVRHWAMDCPAELPFERVLPLLTYLADHMNPHLPAEQALKVWQWLDASRCGKALNADQRQWLVLFGSVAMRDARQMAVTGTALLDKLKDQRTDTTDYAFMASVSGLACLGEGQRTRDLLQSAYQHWLRNDTRPTELRYVASQVRRGARCSAAPPR